MKTIYLIFTLLFTTFSFAQNRKTLLKEIKIFQYTVCKNTSYQTLTNLELLNLSTSYFSKRNYVVFEFNESSITFTKETTVSLTTTYDKIKHSVYLSISSINGLKKIALTDQISFYKEPFTGVEPPKNIGAFYLDKRAFYNYMYINLCGNSVEISKELKTKIKNYNTQQTKEKRQLIAGRDF